MDESGQKKQVCDRCHMPKVEAKPYRITQWISVCKCDSIKLEESFSDQEFISICGDCGKRIESGRSGTLTQWVFRSDICSCNYPVELKAIKKPEAHVEVEQIEESILEISDNLFPNHRYAPLEELGRGASGAVYRCRDKQLNKIVAVKTLHASSDELLILFQNEAKATSSLNHPGIVQIIDFGVSGGSVPYMVLEYVDGISLEEEIKKGELIEIELVLKTFVLIANTLEYAHSKGVFHRDLKPSNILLVNDDFGIRLIDFGIAVMKKDETDSGNTLAGTPAYMSPDQASGLSFDSRSEVYSFGCLLYETLTGKQVFSAETVLETLAMHANRPPPSIAKNRAETIDPVLETLVEKCLAKDPQDRFQNFKEVSELLTVICKEQENLTESVAESRKVKPSSKTPISVLIGGTLVLLVVFAFFGYSIMNRDDTKTESSSPQKALVQKVIEKQRKRDELYSFHDMGDNLYGIKKEPKPTDQSANRSMFEKRVEHRHFVCNAISDQVSDQDLKELQQDKRIEVLSLEGCSGVTGTGLKYLTGTPIKILELEWTNLTKEGASELAKLKEIETLNLSHVKVTAGILEPLKSLKKLKTMYLLDSRVDDQVLKSLAELKSLENLNLTHNWAITYQGLKALRKLPNLRILTIDSNPGITNKEIVQRILPGCKINLSVTPG